MDIISKAHKPLELTTPVTPFKISVPCHKTTCTGEMGGIPQQGPVNPSMGFAHKCSKCGIVRYYTSPYPRIEFRDPTQKEVLEK